MVTVPELVALRGGGINAGNDPEADEVEQDEDEESVFADRHDEAPPVHNPPAGEQQPELGCYPDLAEELQQAVAELANLNLNSKNGDGEESMKTITQRINYLPVLGAPIDIPTAIYAVVAFLDHGTQLPTITACLSKNQQDGEVRAMQAPELNEAQKVLPHKRMLRENASIGHSLTLAVQSCRARDP